MANATRVKIDLSGLQDFAKDVKQSKGGGGGKRIKSRTGGGDNPFEAMYRQWTFRYSAFVRKRFVKLSRSGGGEWPPLKASTKAGRRKGAGSGASAAILRDTSTLLGGLSIGRKGNLTKRIKGGVQFGFGGPARHPNGGLTILRLAEIHQNGVRKKNIPPRPIIVEPDTATRAGMLRDMRRAMARKGF